MAVCIGACVCVSRGLAVVEVGCQRRCSEGGQGSLQHEGWTKQNGGRLAHALGAGVCRVRCTCTVYVLSSPPWRAAVWAFVLGIKGQAFGLVRVCA